MRLRGSEMPKQKCEYMTPYTIETYLADLAAILKEDNELTPNQGLRVLVITDKDHEDKMGLRLANCPDCNRALLRAIMPVKQDRARYHKGQSFNKAYADMLARSED